MSERLDRRPPDKMRRCRHKWDHLFKMGRKSAWCCFKCELCAIHHGNGRWLLTWEAG